MARKDEYRVIVVGIGMVGAEMVRVMRGRDFPAREIKILARTPRTETIDGEDYKVVAADSKELAGYDLAFFAGTEGAKGASVKYGWEAVKQGLVVIDNGKDFRMDPRVPLVVPEVNPDALNQHQGLIANPNCSTIQMVMVLAPIHRVAKVKRVVVSTYQAVSGTGGPAVRELEDQVIAWVKGEPLKAKEYPVQIAFNLIPQIASLKDEFPGYYEEEIKMIMETRKIMGEPDLAVSATCVRVPVFKGHAEAINIQTEKKVSPDEVREMLEAAEGVKVVDDPGKSIWPYSLMAADKDEVFVGRIREDTSAQNAIDLFCVSDNIRKGGALNAVQIAEKMRQMDLL
jgi:aspartate-semialdehyde dehydrogenase